MTTIRQMLNKWQAVDFDQIVWDSIDQTKENIVTFNQINLRYGFKIDGSRIGQYVSVPYAKKKFQQSALAGGGQVDLYLTGDWSYGLTVNVGLKTFTTFSTDYKDGLLTTRYGKEIEGLPQKYQSQYIDILFPVVFGKVKYATVAG